MRPPSRLNNAAGRRLKLVREPVVALQGSSKVATRGSQNAAERSNHIKELTRQYPELVPAASLIPDLAQTSEATNEVTANHDPTTSGLLAFGEAINVTSNKPGVRTIPIIACAAGEAGELVRLVHLAEEKLRWEGNGILKLNTLSATNEEQGWWAGNGGPIQQLVFAEAEGKSSYWLAVRYHGAISILRPLLRTCPDFSSSRDASRIHLPSSHLDANHIVTLPEQNGVPFSGVAFNPWDHKQLATIDQQGDWNVWVVDASLRVKQKGPGTITNPANGHLLGVQELDGGSPHVAADGWGAVLWASDQDTIVVADRTAFAVFDIKSSSRQVQVPVLTSSRASDWILDVKRGSRDPCNVFVATSLCIFWLRMSSSEEEPKTADMKSNVQCLLSWRHFRDQEDISLRLNTLELSERAPVDEDAGPAPPDTSDHNSNTAATKILLYSRLSGLVTVFAFQDAMSLSKQALSALDPYSLELSTEEKSVLRSDRDAHDLHTDTRISDVVLKAVPNDNPDEYMPSCQGQSLVTERVNYYQLSILTHDLALSEGLYAEVDEDSRFSIDPPDTRTRREFSKTPVKVLDDFIVPDVFDDHDYQSSEERLESPSAQHDLEHGKARSIKPDEDPWTISLGWLEKEVHASLSERSPSFDECLAALYATIKETLALQDTPLETLHRVLNTTISVVDIDKATANFTEFLEDASRIEDEEPKEDIGESKRVVFSNISTPSMRNVLGLEDRIQLSAVYDSFIKAWIAPLSRSIPGRARIALEKLLRDLTAKICLASYEMRVVRETDLDEEAPPGDGTGAGAEFVLPVRRRVSATSLRKGKELVARSSSPLASSQISQDVGFLPSSPLRALPTPEPTPSLRSKSSASSLAAAEDPASLRLKAYASLAPQPALPIKMSNLLNHWEVGADPANYDWEAAQQAFNDEDESENEARAKQRQRSERRRKRQRQETIGASSQPPPKRLGGSQPQVAQETQGSSQPADSMAIASQIEPGRFRVRAKPKKKKRTGGF
ncbi:hypothetical protein OEA41_002970 [Lepraria neglecta]|uniref:RNA polymerase I-specific transcription initiation factor RRN6-like protein n=1 Tax=Lepraria neglecta TaxID=209136 RepID=A0AAD9Z4Z5_9LECA|nr:hypothetical protein OEA41_002970 [Lepraria neglecta]